MASEPRNYLEEAQRIAAGRSLLIAEGAHLVAVLAFAESLKQNIATLSNALAAIALDQLQPGQAPVLFIPKDIAEDVARRRISLVLDQQPNGLAVRIVVPELPAPTGESATVN